MCSGLSHVIAGLACESLCFQLLTAGGTCENKINPFIVSYKLQIIRACEGAVRVTDIKRGQKSSVNSHETSCVRTKTLDEN